VAELLLRVENLDRVYGSGDTATHALKGVSFDLAEGEFASIIGQSGSGKSTLLNMLGLLDTPTSGTITYHGQNVSALSKPELAKLRNSLVGFVFQFHHLLPEFSVLENVLMPALIGGKPMPEATKLAEETLGLLGLEGLEGKGANELSGGQKQRVAIARALMNRPALLLADEPTGNLDTSNTDQVYKLFRKVSAETGTSFLIVTHDRNVAQQTDRIFEVLDGKLVQDIRNDYAGASR
jgi:lipoprotein-releasing system ATP-binding protein